MRTIVNARKNIFRFADMDEMSRAILTGISKANTAAYDVWSVKKGLHEP